MSATQIRVPTTLTGSNQVWLKDLISAQNDFFGLSGSDWNNTGGGGRWDAGAAFDGTLAAVTGQPLDVILQEIDNFSLGGSDTSITTGSLAQATADRTADFNTHALTLDNVTAFTLNSSGLNTLVGSTAAIFKNASAAAGAATQWFEGSTNGTNYIQLAAAAALTNTQSYTWPDAYPIASSGYFLGSDTGGQWSWVVPANITTGTLATATGTRTVPMGAQALTISNSGTITFQTDSILVKGRTVSVPGEITFQEAPIFGSDTVTIAGPSQVTSSYKLRLPGSIPAAVNQVLAVQTIGSPTATLYWMTPPNLTQGTLAPATGHRGADFDAWNLTLSDITSFTVDAVEHNFRLNDSSTLLARVNTSGLFVASGRTLYLTGSTSGNVGIKAPATLPISGQVYTWPDGFPSSTKVLQSTNAGILSWVDPTSGGDTSITAGSLSNASAARTVPMNGQSLGFAQVAGFTVESSDAGILVQNSGGTNGGRLYLEESGAGTNTIGHQAPASITTSVLYTWPEAPASNGYVLSCTTAGVMSWQAAGADNNITSGTLPTASGNRTADFGDNDLDFTNVGQFTISSDGVNLQGDSPSGSGILSLLDNNNSNYVAWQAASNVTTSYFNILPAAPGSNGQVLGISSGGGTGTLTLGWVDNGGGTDTSITAGTLSTATGDRTADFGTNALTLDNVTNFTLNGSGLNTFIGATAAVFKDSSASAGAETQWFEGSTNGTNYVALTAPAALTNTQTYTFPDAYPGADSGYFLTSTTGGAWSWGIPANITAGSLATASGARTAPFGGNTLTFDNITTFTVEANSTIFKDQPGTNELARIDTSGVKLGPGQYLQFTKSDGSQQTTFNQNESATTSPSYTLPIGLPGGSGYVLQCDASGNMSWGTVSSVNTNITSGTLTKANENRLVDFDDLYSLTLDNMTSFVALADAHDFKLRNGTLLGRLNASGLFVSSGKTLYLTDGSSGNVGIKAPATLSTSGQVYTWPNGFPGSTMFLQCDASGVLSWATPSGSSTSRQENADAMGSVSGSVTINFDANSYDNKSYTITGDTTFTLSATRPTTYRVMLTASGGKHALSWGEADGDLPLYVDSAIEGSVIVHLVYHGSRWECRKTTVPTVTVTAASIDSATGGGATPYQWDVGRVYRSIHVTGTLSNVITWGTPLNLPTGGVMQVTWASSQSNVPVIDAGYVMFSDDPTHAGRTIYTCNANTLGIAFCASDEVA